MGRFGAGEPGSPALPGFDELLLQRFGDVFQSFDIIPVANEEGFIEHLQAGQRRVIRQSQSGVGVAGQQKFFQVFFMVLLHRRREIQQQIAAPVPPEAIQIAEFIGHEFKAVTAIEHIVDACFAQFVQKEKEFVEIVFMIGKFPLVSVVDQTLIPGGIEMGEADRVDAEALQITDNFRRLFPGGEICRRSHVDPPHPQTLAVGELKDRPDNLQKAVFPGRRVVVAAEIPDGGGGLLPPDGKWGPVGGHRVNFPDGGGSLVQNEIRGITNLNADVKLSAFPEIGGFPAQIDPQFVHGRVPHSQVVQFKETFSGQEQIGPGIP